MLRNDCLIQGMGQYRVEYGLKISWDCKYKKSHFSRNAGILQYGEIKGYKYRSGLKRIRT